MVIICCALVAAKMQVTYSQNYFLNASCVDSQRTEAAAAPAWLMCCFCYEACLDVVLLNSYLVNSERPQIKELAGQHGSR